MNKSELAGQVAERAGVSGAEAGRVLDATLEAIEEALASGSDVNITGFGKFSVADRAARQGVNPATGEPIKHPLSSVSLTGVARFGDSA